MSGNARQRMWGWLRGQVYEEAGHAQVVPFEEEKAAPLVADKSYFRVSLSEFHLATARSWGTDRKPAVKASVKVLVATAAGAAAQPAYKEQEFAVLVQTPVRSGHGVFEDYPLTEWLPYQGQPVQLAAALYAILGQNRLLTAIDVIAGFASLVTQPVSAALTIADQVASGIEKVIAANGTAPRLPVHTSLTGPGWIAVVDATEDALPSAELHLNRARQLCRDGKRLTGHDYLVLRVESRKERDDWRTPDLVLAIAGALNARDNGGTRAEFSRLRKEALSKVYLSPDFTTVQRRKVAVAVRDELDDTSYGAAGDGEVSLAGIVARRGLPGDDEVEFLTLDQLLSG